MIEHLTDFPPNVLAFACKGQVTAREYDEVLVPVVERALKRAGKMRLYYRVDADFTGIEPGAVWEDVKVGMDHLTRWERIAVVTDVAWIAHTIQAFGFLMPAKVKVFSLAEAEAARVWVEAPQAS